MKRNPLALALGFTLKQIRVDNDIKVSEIASLIGLKDSHYRVIESGSTTVHINKTMDIVIGFNEILESKNSKTTLSYEGLQKILLCIGYINAFYIKKDNQYVIDVNEKNVTFSNIEALEPKLFVLLSDFDRAEVFGLIHLNNKQMVDHLNQFSLLIRLKMFLTEQESFAESPSEKQESFAINFFKNIPSYYLDFMTNMKNNLLSLPVEIAFNEVNNKWEVDNRDNIVSCVGIVREPAQILAQTNLDKYRYGYLWGYSFVNSRFFIVSNEFENKKIDGTRFKEIFKSNLRKAWGDNIPEYFEEKTNKITFKILPDDKLKSAEELLNSKYNEMNEKFDASWVFSLKNLSNVGFKIKEKVEEDYRGRAYHKLKHGISLTHQETVPFIEKFSNLWNEV